MYNYIFTIGLTRCQSRKNCCDSSVCDSSVCVSKDISRYESETCHDNMYCIIIGSILVSGFIVIKNSYMHVLYFNIILLLHMHVQVLCLAIVSVAVWALVSIH